jgi:hypothetical protein
MASLAFLAMVGYSYAACDNHCSGHGTCGFDDVCDCYDNWRMGDADSGDCSDRVCPYEIAWVDNPDVDGNIHRYSECAGRGICDRSTGQCECFEGYTGKGCQRTTCPNDCSGHGTCEYLEDLPFGSVWGDYSSTIGQTLMNDFTYYDWDVKKTRGCLCDPQYTDVDCSRRMCPKANDVMDERLDLTDTLLYQVQTISIYSWDSLSSSDTFALTFKSTINETFTTIPINFDSNATNMALYVENALLNLPNYVIDGVTVTADAMADNFTLQVTFDGDNVQGPQNLLMFESLECGSGCTPQVTGIQTLSTSMINQTTAADYNNYECGRRGKCDYETGLCECFEGYKGLACNEQTALV